MTGPVLVTGADGFIGSHLVETLLEEGREVRALALYNSFGSTGWLETIPRELRGGLEIVLGDIRDRSCVVGAAKGTSAILHLAALIAIPYSYRAPESYIDTNVTGTLNVLEAARLWETGRVVCTSTSEIYGTAQFVPITEEHPVNPQSPYAASKAAADHLALSYEKSFGLPVAVLRPFNTYGPRQSARAVIPTIITQLARGAEEIRLGAVSPTRDFTFVRDTAAGFVAAMRADRAIGRVTNIGSGFEISVGETAAAIGRVMGRNVEIVSDEERLRPEASEVERLFAGVEVAEDILGWAPAHGGREGFDKGLERTIEWFTEPANLARYPEGYQV
ncbi:GDP-mannose 4,6-dehydratase [Nisaea sediminum]|uniref:GDP-mannose 4,6-dehydratase n=1 Tax=Nisaea sediminum TaxID=2775867 RepID=UPI001865F04B|nr:GDP-mannose 4,6-dehydratase [Nisaea sediminum]